MAHTHPQTHDHEHNTYYVGQLCMIAICGAIGAVAVLWWSRELWFLVPGFRLPVLAGGIALLALVAMRGICLWIAVGKAAKVHTHDHHHHHHDHDHDHEHCDHDHSHEHGGHEHAAAHAHDHEHSAAPWRYTVLLLPIVFFMLALPNKGFSSLYGKNINLDELEESKTDVADRGHVEVQFQELEKASFSPTKRAYYEGKTVRMKGQFTPAATSNRRFTLVRYLMVHCAADALRLNMVIDCAQDLPVRSLYDQWVEVTGKVTFRKLGGREEYVVVLSVPEANDVKTIPADSNFFLYNK